MTLESTIFDDFHGGLDLVSSPNTIKAGFTPDAKNFRISEYGGIEKVLGYTLHDTLPEDGNDLFHFSTRDDSIDLMLAATATKVVILGGATLESGRTTETDTTFAAYDDLVYFLGDHNDLRSWDGIAGSPTTHAPGVNTGPARGQILGIWNNRMFVSPTGTSRVEWSEPGVITGTGSWPLDNFVELGGTGSSERIIGGQVSGDGLYLFTQNATYLVYDDETGAMRVVDPTRGCSSRRSIASSSGVIMGVNESGVWAVSGGQPQVVVSPKIQPLFSRESPNLSTAAGVFSYGAFLLSYDRFRVHNSMTLDVAPLQGMSIMANDYPSHCWASSSDDDLYFIDASDRTKVQKAFTGSTFDGVAIGCYYETQPLSLAGDQTLKRLRRVRLVGQGTLIVAARNDYKTYDAEEVEMGLGSAGDISLWDTAEFDDAEFPSFSFGDGWGTLRCRGRRITLRLSDSSIRDIQGRDILGAVTMGSLPGLSIYQVEAIFNTTNKRR